MAEDGLRGVDSGLGPVQPMPGSATVTLVYFAWVREKIGRDREQVTLPAGVETVADLVVFLRTRGQEYESAFARPEVVRAALDHVHAKPGASLDGVREVAFFPPVTGG